jgi:hypothetical protein
VPDNLSKQVLIVDPEDRWYREKLYPSLGLNMHKKSPARLGIFSMGFL